MKQLLWFLFIVYGIPLSAQITFSEIMFDPTGDENSDEWIELYNNADSVISLENWTLRVDGSVDSLRIFASDSSNEVDWFLQPKEFALIHDSDYPDGAQPFEEIIPDSTPRFLIGDSRFGQYGLSNSSGRVLQLMDTSGTVVSEYQYSPDNQEGYTDEKIDLTGINTAENWANSLALNGTPGKRNSVSPRDYDLALISPAVWFPDPPFPDSALHVNITVKNVGLFIAENASLSIGRDANSDSALQSDEILETVPVPSLNAGDSTNLAFEISLPSGVNQFVANVDYPADDDTSNNSMVWDISVQFEPASVVINEIMYAPEDGPEWIEIYNRSTEVIDLSRWTITDASENTGTIETNSITIQPDSFAVITADPSLENYYTELNPDLIAFVDELPTLNNSSDAVVLRSPAGEVQDSVFYFSTWGGDNGKSLERKNPDAESNQPENWVSSEAESGATPGRTNSIAAADVDLKLQRAEFSGDETPAVKAVIANIGRTTQANWMLNLYHDVNEDQITPQNELFEQRSGNMLNPGDSTIMEITLSEPLHGYHQFVAEIQLAADQNPENNTTAINYYFGYPDSTIRINEIMYHPETGEPEWVELYVAQDSVDFRHWILKDAGHKGEAISGTKHLYQQGEFVILAEDQSVLQSYPDLDFPVITVDHFPTLNNGTDSVRIFDATTNLQDDFEYSSEMGGDVGISLERINLAATTTEANNWGSSVSELGATPGNINSIAILDNDVVVDPISVTVEPKFPKPNENWNLSFQVKNAGLNPVSNLDIFLYEDRNADHEFESGELYFQDSHNINLTTNDSAEINLVVPGLNRGVHPLRLFVSMPNEMRPTDNIADFTVSVSFPEQTLLITEFAPIPGEGWSEFVEIYNPTSDTISLENWALTDNSASAKITILPLDLLPEQYAVLAPDSSINQEFSPPDNAQYCVISKWRSLNNSGDAIVLEDPTGKIIDSLSYTTDWDISSGVSKERRWYLNSTVEIETWEPENWLNSGAEKGATPGWLNSQAVIESQVLALSIDSLARAVKPAANMSGEFLLRNAGLDSVTDIQILSGFDADGDSLLKGDEVQSTQDVPSLAPLDSQRIQFELIAPMTPGVSRCVAEVKYGDTMLVAWRKVWIPYPRQSILLSEVFPDPSLVFPSEFVELVNITNHPMELSGWTLHVNDRSISLQDSANIQPREYIVLSEDSLNTPAYSINQIVPDHWSALPNADATIEVFDPFGYKMDSLHYYDTEAGHSLERIHLKKEINSAANWRASVARDGATPGQQNSFYVNPDSVASGWTVSPSAFSPDEDGSNDILKIIYNGQSALEYVTIKIYDSTGRLIKSLVRDKPAPTQYTWLWDGRDNKDRIAPIDIYLVQIRYKPLNHSKQQKLFTAVLAKSL